MVRISEARVWKDADYMKVRDLCENMQGWNEKKGITIYSKTVPCNRYHMFKAVAKFPDVLPSLAYDVLQDTSYRTHWDRHMADQSFIGIINPNSDIGYYALSSIPPIRARDFVMQRSWLDTGNEKLICGNSVYHQDYPPKKGYVRGIAFLSAYLIKPLSDKGCQIIHISHSDPRGTIPTWLVNRITRVLAPKLIRKLHDACLAYTKWKEENQPDFKPWIYPKQQACYPRIDMKKCQAKEYTEEIFDESENNPEKSLTDEDE
ncbi:START domain protein [Dictyocaulus viviparus]|uniref:START domain protein n=1 Tax=Dictyocaulus viviparus TaxID=29172 RepID=A0A0D8Y3K7_DICVI|nr:START domain protein [Dictyocaulus viviparus]